MNVAIEYVLRKGRVEQLLALPCSLFLENAVKKKDSLGGKLVVALTPRYGTNSVIVRQYPMWKITSSDVLPPYEESVISLEDIFQHPNVVVPRYELLEFQPQPFDSEEKQVNDLPLAAIQERQYRECLTTFFSPKTMNKVREDWLWTCFNSVHVGAEVRNHHSMRHYYNYARGVVQRENIKREHKAIYKVWEMWKRNLLLNSNPSSELVFAKHYDSQFLKYVPPPEEEKALKELIQPLVPPKPKKRRIASMFYYPDAATQQMIKRARAMRN